MSWFSSKDADEQAAQRLDKVAEGLKREGYGPCDCPTPCPGREWERGDDQAARSSRWF